MSALTFLKFGCSECTARYPWLGDFVPRTAIRRRGRWVPSLVELREHSRACCRVAVNSCVDVVTDIVQYREGRQAQSKEKTRDLRTLSIIQYIQSSNHPSLII